MFDKDLNSCKKGVILKVTYFKDESKFVTVETGSFMSGKNCSVPLSFHETHALIVSVFANVSFWESNRRSISISFQDMSTSNSHNLFTISLRDPNKTLEQNVIGLLWSSRFAFLPCLLHHGNMPTQIQHRSCVLIGGTFKLSA